MESKKHRRTAEEKCKQRRSSAGQAKAERALERQRCFTNKDVSLVSAIVHGVHNREKPELLRKFYSVLLSMSNKRTVKFLLANVPNLDGTDTALRTVQRWRAAYRFNMKPRMCRSNFVACAKIYQEVMKDFGITGCLAGASI